jgi:signal transduction histidine kinase
MGGELETPRLQVTVSAPDCLPPLPAAVEVAAYRIIQEGLTNVIRHAHAGNCTIQIELTDTLTIEIVDDGIGLPAEHRIGIGLGSMRERAAELGGSCVIERGRNVGTRVYACLPLLNGEANGHDSHSDR